MVALFHTPVPAQRLEIGVPIETSAGAASLVLLSDGRWLVVADRDLYLRGIGETAAAALLVFERRAAP